MSEDTKQRYCVKHDLYGGGLYFWDTLESKKVSVKAVVRSLNELEEIKLKLKKWAVR